LEHSLSRRLTPGAKLIRRTVVGLVMVAVVGHVVAFTGLSTVQASCDPSRSPKDSVARYVATIANETGITGVSAYIEQYDPGYTKANPTGTNATEMITNVTRVGWAQLGWFESLLDGGTEKRESGAEFHDATQNYFLWYGARPIGEATWYEITNPSANNWDLYINGTYVGFGIATFAGSQYQFFGETHNLQDQMPGGVGNHVSFQNMVYFTGHYTGHYITSTMGTSYPAWYGVSNPTVSNADIWDKGCAS
jgi:hypothetical protein